MDQWFLGYHVHNFRPVSCTTSTISHLKVFIELSHFFKKKKLTSLFTNEKPVLLAVIEDSHNSEYSENQTEREVFKNPSYILFLAEVPSLRPPLSSKGRSATVGKVLET